MKIKIKENLTSIGNLLIILGIVFFMLRGLISSVNSNEPFARDLFGFPLLESPFQEVSRNTWLYSMIGFLIPYILIGVGYWIKSLAKKYQQLNKEKLYE